jgi:hypothetical protein
MKSAMRIDLQVRNRTSTFSVSLQECLSQDSDPQTILTVVSSHFSIQIGLYEKNKTRI